MSKQIDIRDKLAAIAMAAIIRKAPFTSKSCRDQDMAKRYLATAFGAYAYADAMLIARDYSKNSPTV